MHRRMSMHLILVQLLPCLLYTSGIVGVENLGGDLDKIVPGKWFDFHCYPIRWYMGDGSMAHPVAYVDEENIDPTVPDLSLIHIWC